MNNSNLTQDAIQDAITPDFLAYINRQTEARRNAKQTAQTAQRHKKARKATQSRRYANQYTFLRLTSYALWPPIIVAVLYLFGLVPLIPTIAVWWATVGFLVGNAVAFITHRK